MQLDQLYENELVDKLLPMEHRSRLQSVVNKCPKTGPRQPTATKTEREQNGSPTSRYVGGQLI